VLVGAPSEDSSATGVSAVAAGNSNAPGSGAAYLFSRDTAVWTQLVYIKASNTGQGDGFGATVAMSSNGDTLAIGAPGEDSSAIGVNGDENNDAMIDTAAVYVFERSGNTWARQAYLKPPFPDPDGGAPTYSMQALALSGDGNTLAMTTILEASNARGIDGNGTDMSMPSSGAAYVYARNNATWAHQAYVKASNTDANDQFGNSVDLSNDGTLMVIGAPGESSGAAGVGGDEVDNGADKSGAVYVFRRAGEWEQINYVHAHSPDPEDLFGTSVSLSGNGTSLVVGAPQEDGNGDVFNADADDETAMQAGAAYVY
jgi:trimeric autotransporter adhesin